MNWITLFLLALASLGLLATAWELNRIRQVLSGTRPLPWTALVEIKKRVAAGDDTALAAVEQLMKERGEATVGDWLADSACAEILKSLLGSPTEIRSAQVVLAGQSAVAAPPPVKANGRADLGAGSYGQL